MHTAIEIKKPLVAALRMSAALPNTEDHGTGSLHLLYGEHYVPVGYLVEKVNNADQWDMNDPRFFLTTSHEEAVRLLAMPFSELPDREGAVA